MKSEWLHYSMLRAASLLAPGNQRAEWVQEWQSELWYIRPRQATLFCLGSFRDALWLRRNNPNPVKRTGIHLDSPLSCLALLATLAAVSLCIAVCLPAQDAIAPVRAGDLPRGCVSMLVFSWLLIPATVAVGWAPASRYPTPWHRSLCRGIFLALKIALIHPLMFCAFVAVGPITPVFIVACILALRWVLADQRRRCPVCLRLLTKPVRIGTPSQTFLEWYGAESTCSRGHGLLHTSEISASYAQKSQWLCLDGSWSGLFPAAANPAAKSGR